jgi:ABC-type multidrug transport system permease subunit
MNRLWAMVWARSLEFLRDRSALAWNLLFPLLAVAGIAVIFAGPGQPLFKAAVIADAPLDAKLHPFLGTPHVQFYAERDADAALAKVQRHRVDMLVDLRTPPGRYWINERSPKGVTLERILAGSGGPVLQRQLASGASIRYVDWLVPGVLGMNMMLSCLFGLGYVIVRYRKSGYLKRLNATPVRAVEFIVAQLLSRLGLILLITVFVFVGCNFFLHFRMEGRYLDLLLITVLGAMSMLSLGLLVAARVTGEELAGGLLNLLSWPMMMLSGVFFSLDGAPAFLRSLSQVLPLTHLIEGARAIMLDGAGLAAIAPHLAMLAGMTAVFLLLGSLLFRWTQD